MKTSPVYQNMQLNINLLLIAHHLSSKNQPQLPVLMCSPGNSFEYMTVYISAISVDIDTFSSGVIALISLLQPSE